MATVINNPGQERVIERSTDSTAGWAIAVLILLAVVVVGAIFWARYRGSPAAPAAPATQSSPGASVNVTLPSAGYQPSGNTGASGSGSAGSGNTQTPSGQE